jgi:ATP-dependent 26S proteasome regulatory subunit
MTTSEALDQLRSRILARYTLLFLKTWEEERWESELVTLALEIERGLVVWSITSGPLPPVGRANGDVADPLHFLEQIDAYPPDHLFLIKDFHPYLRDPKVLRKLRDLAVPLADAGKTLLFIGPVGDIPLELRKDAVGMELPLPGIEELRDELHVVLAERRGGNGRSLEVTEDEEDRLVKAVLGLTARESRKAMSRALLGRDRIDDEVFAALVSEKRRLVQGSDLLQFYDLEEGVGDVGGLDALKDWLAQRAEAFSARAREQGIPAPKGMLLLGVQGCGKSLTARATARLLSFPLVRLDAANLLSSDQGSSEKNMRDVLTLMEMIAPAVLWLDEIEKGFAGTAGEGPKDSTMSRMMGGLLTWMEEHRAPVFVVATANSVQDLPPEMLRRGRFDELFFIDLPNYHERKNVFEIHLAKRGWKPEKYDIAELASRTEGYSGAEIEQIVISAMLEAFDQKRILTDKDLENARENTVPLSVTMEEKIFELREWARSRCRPATPDSRVLQMLEDEQRHSGGSTAVFEELVSPESGEWVALAEHGQLSTAVVEFVRKKDHVTFPQLQEAFAQYIETSGEQGLALRSDPNVVLWVGMSQELAELISKLIAGKRLYLHQTDAGRYKANGKQLKLTPLESLPEDRIAKPAWLPTCLRDLPPEGGSGRFGRVARMKLSR